MKKRSKSATKKASRPLRKNAFSSKGGRLSPPIERDEGTLIFSRGLSIAEETADGAMVVTMRSRDFPGHVVVRLPAPVPVLEAETDQFMSELGDALPQAWEAKEDRELTIQLGDVEVQFRCKGIEAFAADDLEILA